MLPDNSEKLLSEKMKPALKKIIIGAAAIGFLPPVDEGTAPFYNQLNVGFTIPSVGPAYDPKKGIIRANIPELDWQQIGGIATNITGDNVRRSVIIFCHEVLHALHHCVDEEGYSAMTKEKDPQYSWTEERYTIAGIKALLDTQHKPKLDTLVQQTVSTLNEHLMCEKLGFMKRTNASDSLMYPLSKQAQDRFGDDNRDSISALLKSYEDKETRGSIDRQVGQRYGKALANGESVNIVKVLNWIKEVNNPSNAQNSELSSQAQAPNDAMLSPPIPPPPPPPPQSVLQDRDKSYFSTNPDADMAGQPVVDAGINVSQPSATTVSESPRKLTNIVKGSRAWLWPISKSLKGITSQEKRDKVDLELGTKYWKDIKEGKMTLPALREKIKEEKLVMEQAPLAASTIKSPFHNEVDQAKQSISPSL